MLRVYITDLAAYNQGFLVGKWVSLPMYREDLEVELLEVLKEGAEICKDSEHEEYFITDYEFESDYKLFEVHEYSNLEEINYKCEQLENFSESDLKRVSYLIDHLSFKFEDALENYEDVIVYENMNLKEVVEDYINETVDFSNIPNIIANNIDYDAIARDFEILGEYEEIENDVFYYVNLEKNFS